MYKNPRTHSLFFLLLILWGTFFLTLMNKDKLTAPVDAEASGLQLVYLPIARNYVPVKTHFGSEMQPIDNNQGLKKMAQANASWVRRNGILWSEIEPIQGGGYDWSSLASLETEFLYARDNYMEVVGVIRGVPEWARMPPYNYACGPINLSLIHI